jgi:mitochondrial fission protein ELM1
MKIWIVSDGTDSIVQSYELAKNLASADNIYKIYKDEFNPNLDELGGNYPDLAIGVGFNVADILVNIKEKSLGKTKIAIILDPLKYYEKFDFIILPSYEPYKVQGNVIWTVGLLNFVNEKFISENLLEYKNFEKYKFLRDKNLKSPFLTAIIGGRHTGGNVDDKDAEIIANKINELVLVSGGTALISTSRRTEVSTTETLKNKIKVPAIFYDYKSRQFENPYGVFLALADEIMVTGESVRMMSECCSTGKKVRIYRPQNYGFQYDSLINEFINNGYALEFGDENFNTKTKKLDEASRVAGLILEKLS